MKIQLLDRYFRDKSKLQYTLLKISKNINSIESFWSQNPEQSHHIFSADVNLDRIRIDSIKTLTINLLKIYGEQENITQYFEWSIFDLNHKLEYKACKELVKEGKLVEVKHWYSFKRKFRLKTIKDIRKEKLEKLNDETV
jgi:hypothetical protein